MATLRRNQNHLTSPADPGVWMHHAQIDRIWSIWTTAHTGKPSLQGNAQVLDPWPERAQKVNSVAAPGCSPS